MALNLLGPTRLPWGGLANVPSRDEVKNAIFGTLKANNMQDGVHIRLTLTRGLKSTSGMKDM